jgi:hypothetical protein
MKKDFKSFFEHIADKILAKLEDFFFSFSEKVSDLTEETSKLIDDAQRHHKVDKLGNAFEGKFSDTLDKYFGPIINKSTLSEVESVFHGFIEEGKDGMKILGDNLN